MHPVAQLIITPPANLNNLVVPFSNVNNAPTILVSRLLLFAISGAGFVFLAQVIMAGYKYLTSLGEPASIQSATKQLLHSLTGLLIVITTFFIIQILETVFGLDIL